MSQPERLRILFIARAYPPTVGGMENMAHHLLTSMTNYADVTPLVNRRGKRALPWFLPYAVVAGARLAKEGRPDAIHIADALLAPVGLVLKRLTRLPVTASVHGLDLTFPNGAYQAIVPKALGRLNLVIANSHATEAVIPRLCGDVPTAAIPLGLNPLPEPDREVERSLRERIGITTGGRKRTLLTVGRLIRRKGIAWFVGHVLPQLPKGVTYVVIGEGPEREAVLQAAHGAGVADRLRLPGYLSDDELAAAYRIADVFVMPNVPVPGDMEGFGLVALEAAAAGVPVVASRLEGITEAIRDGSNGILVDPLDADALTAALKDLLRLNRTDRKAMGAAFADYTARQFAWSRTARQYVDAIGQVAA